MGVMGQDGKDAMQVNVRSCVTQRLGELDAQACAGLDDWDLLPTQLECDLWRCVRQNRLHERSIRQESFDLHHAALANPCLHLVPIAPGGDVIAHKHQLGRIGAQSHKVVGKKQAVAAKGWCSGGAATTRGHDSARDRHAIKDETGHIETLIKRLDGPLFSKRVI
jgi:hypothetical protein